MNSFTFSAPLQQTDEYSWQDNRSQKIKPTFVALSPCCSQIHPQQKMILFLKIMVLEQGTYG